MGGGVGEEDRLPSVSNLVLFPRVNLQKKACRYVHKQNKSHLISISDTREDRSRLLSCGGHGASEWLSVLPFSPPFSFSSNDFKCACRYRLGLSLPSSCLSSVCVCGKKLDDKGYHAMTCGKGSARIARHDAVKFAFGSIIKEVYRNVLYERSLADLKVVAADHPDSRKKMDVVFRPSVGGQCLADIMVVYPPCGTYIKAHSDTKEGAAAKAGAAIKTGKYGENVRKAGHTLVPLIVESYGAWGEEAITLIHELAVEAASRKTGPARPLVAAFKRQWWQKLSCALQKGNVGLIESRVSFSSDQEESSSSCVHDLLNGR